MRVGSREAEAGFWEQRVKKRGAGVESFDEKKREAERRGSRGRFCCSDRS